MDLARARESRVGDVLSLHGRQATYYLNRYVVYHLLLTVVRLMSFAFLFHFNQRSEAQD